MPPKPQKPSLNLAQKALLKTMATMSVGTGLKEVIVNKIEVSTAYALDRRGLVQMSRQWSSVFGYIYFGVLTEAGWVYAKQMGEQKS